MFECPLQSGGIIPSFLSITDEQSKASYLTNALEVLTGQGAGKPFDKHKCIAFYVKACRWRDIRSFGFMYTTAVLFWQRHLIASDRVARPIGTSGVRQSSSQFPWCPQQHIQGRFSKYFQDIFKPLLAEVGRNSWHRLSMKSDKILFSAHSTFILRT